jgi:uncharacterized protein YegJ (DUF2314 family)
MSSMPSSRAFMRIVTLAALVAGLGVALCWSADATERSSIDVPVGDPMMVAAYAQARAGLDDFLVKLGQAPPGTGDYSVKVGLKDGPAPGGFSIGRAGEADNEFFWIVDVRSTASGFSGEIGNEPDLVKNVGLGQTISFEKSDIVDWLYFENGKMKGNYTACPALLHGPKEVLEQMRRQFGITC